MATASYYYANSGFAAPTHQQQQYPYQPSPYDYQIQQDEQYARQLQQQLNPYATAPLQPPAASVYGSHVQQYQQATSDYTAYTPGPIYQPPPPQDLTYVLHITNKHKGTLRDKYRDSYTWSLRPLHAPSTSPAAYTITFTGPSKLHKEADLITYRGDTCEEVGRVTWVRSAGMQNLSIRFPFMAWPSPWDPDAEEWGSDAGTLGNEMRMKWISGPQQCDTETIGEGVQRCVTTGKNMKGDFLGEHQRNRELCRVSLNEDEKTNKEECARIILDGTVFRPGCRREQMDEMVTLAAANCFRKSMRWTAKDIAAGVSSATPFPTKEALEFTNELLQFTANVVGASGGGGGGC